MKKLEDEIRGKRQKKGKLFLFKKKKFASEREKDYLELKEMKKVSSLNGYSNSHKTLKNEY